MDAIEFIKERNRMCKAYYEAGDDVCSNCPAKWEQCNTISSLMGENADTVVAIVEKWSAEHPRKTRQGEFLKQHPNASLDEDGILRILPCYIDKNFEYSTHGCSILVSCTTCTRNYWSKEVE